MSKEKILEEFDKKFRLTISSYSSNAEEITDNIKQFLIKAIDQTREETIREVEEGLPLEYHPNGDSEKGYNACLGEIKIKINKLKK